MKDYTQHKAISLNETDLNYANNIAFANSKNEFLVSSSDSKNCYLFDLDGNLLQKFTGHKKEVLCCAFSPNDEFIATGSKDSTIKLFNKNTGKIVWTSEKLKAHGSFLNRPYGWIKKIGFINENEILVVGINVIVVYSVNQGRLIKNVSDGPSDLSLKDFALNDQSLLLTTFCTSKTIRPKKMFETSYEEFSQFVKIIDLNSLSTSVISFQKKSKHTAPRFPILFLEDNTFATAIDDIISFNELSGKLITTIKMPKGYAYAFDTSANSKYLAVGGMYDNLIIDLKSKSIIKSFQDGTERSATDIRFSQDSNFLCTVGSSQEIKIWKLNELI